MSAHREPRLPPSWDGSVVLDIGGDVGALTLHVPAALSGREIDLEPLDGGTRTHTEVRARHHAGRVWHAAVYPRLRAGRYRVEGSGQVVAVAGGRVTDVQYETDAATTVAASRE